MPTRVHDHVVLGTLVIVVLAAIGGAITVVGFPGSVAETTVSDALKHANGAVQRAFPSLETLAKLAGLAITLLSGAYAIYQKIYYAEFNMKTRLREFLEREESRLNDSNKHIAKALLRPSPDRDFESPIFTNKTLKPALKRFNWIKKRKPDESLEAKLTELAQQLDVSDRQKNGYKRHMAQAYLLKGAIAAARAPEAAVKGGVEARNDHNVEALEYFQKAFELSDEKDPEALEYVGHQQVRLGNYDVAFETFKRLEEMFARIGSSVEQARALKFQAQVSEFRQPPRPHPANAILGAALNVLPADAPDLEKGEIHEMHVRVRVKCGHLPAAKRSYERAHFWYQRFINHNSSENEDVLVAQAALQRVRKAIHDIQEQFLERDDDEGGTTQPQPIAPTPLDGPTPPPNTLEDAPKFS
jgi:tetratricopeptide (TPR) repeat protein